MTVTAFGAIGALVNIIYQVTGRALLVQGNVENICPVATTAVDLSVPALQCKTTDAGMIKIGLIPLSRLVALIAFLAVAALMVIVDLMT